MDIGRFTWLFDYLFPLDQIFEPQLLHTNPDAAKHLDSCPDVSGMTSISKQRLLHAAFHCLPEGEAFLEVGTYNGKSLISAALGNEPRPIFACDDFSEFSATNTEAILRANLARYELSEQAQFFNGDFRRTFASGRVNAPVGLYFYDGAHDEQSQFDGISLAEPLLADEALVIVDDWRLANDSGSYAEAGTLRAMESSRNQYELLYLLPARFNGDLEMWWNGVAVFAFRRLG